MNPKKNEPLTPLEVKEILVNSQQYSNIKAEAIRIAESLDNQKKEKLAADKAKGVVQPSIKEIAESCAKNIINNTKFYHEPKLDVPKNSKIKPVTFEESLEMMKKATDNF